MKKPKTLKEIKSRKFFHKRRKINEIIDDIIHIFDLVHNNHHSYSNKRKRLKVLLFELEETASHEGAKNSYC